MMKTYELSQDKDFLNGHDPNDGYVKEAIKDMEKSGLTFDTLSRAGVKLYSGNDKELKSKLGFSNFDGNPILKSCILLEIPYKDRDGNTDFYEFKPYPPLGDVKYLHPKGIPAYPYIPPEVYQIANKTNKPIWITEGVKKALKLIQHGRPTISISGVWNFRAGAKSEETESKELWKEIEAINWEGRTVFLGFDSDLWTNPQVRKALYTLAFRLIEHGAIVKFPFWYGEKGIDDYLAKSQSPEKEIEKLEGDAKSIDKFISFEHRGDITYALSTTAPQMDAITKEGLIKIIAKCFGVNKSLVQEEIANTSQETEENIIIAHPSYEINHEFMSIGFKETIIKDDRPDSRNTYLLCKNNNFELHGHPCIKTDTGKIIFDERESTLITLNDKWSKDRMLNFINNPVAPTGLYNETKEILRQYIEFQNEAFYGLLSAWIIATYFHRIFNAFPFLFFYGKKQSGKSRMLELLNLLAFNAIKVKGITEASMTDSIDKVRATFLIDQAEMLSQKDKVELLGILADSYTPGGGKRRIVHITNKSRKVLEFESFSPKAFASIKEIDTDLKDRCIEIVMLRAGREFPYPEPYLPIWLNYRDKFYRLLLTRWRDVMEIYKTAGEGTKQRVKELWKPLDTILILENVPDNEKQGIKKAFLDSMLETQAGLTELEEKLIDTINDMLGDSGERILTTSEITDKMALQETETFKKKEQTKWVGRTINKLYLYTEKLGRTGNKHQYLFTSEHILNISRRYQIDGIDGATAEGNTINGLQDAIKKTGDGATAYLMAQDEENAMNDAISAINTKPNGAQETVDTSQSCHYAITAIDLFNNQKEEINYFIPEEDDIPEFEGERWQS